MNLTKDQAEVIGIARKAVTNVDLTHPTETSMALLKFALKEVLGIIDSTK